MRSEYKDTTKSFFSWKSEEYTWESENTNGDLEN